MFKKIVLLSLVPCAAQAMNVAEARKEITKLLACCVYSQTMVKDQNNTYSKLTVVPQPKTICQELQRKIAALDPQTRMSLLFKDQNLMRAFPIIKQLHRPLEIIHSNQDIFECLQKMYAQYEPEMYITFIKKIILDAFDNIPASPGTIKTLSELPKLLPEIIYIKALKHNNQELLTWADNLALQRSNSKKAILIYLTMKELYTKAKLAEPDLIIEQI